MKKTYCQLCGKKKECSLKRVDTRHLVDVPVDRGRRDGDGAPIFVRRFSQGGITHDEHLSRYKAFMAGHHGSAKLSVCSGCACS